MNYKVWLWLGLFALLLAACDQLILGSAEEGDTVILRLGLADPSESSANISLDLDYTINTIKVGVGDVSLENRNSELFNFVISDSFATLSNRDTDLLVSEKIVPEGGYGKLNLLIRSPGSETAIPSAVSTSPGSSGFSSISSGNRKTTGDRTALGSDRKEGLGIDPQLSGKHANGTEKDDLPQLVSSESGSAGTSGNTSGSFSIQITGEFRGDPFVYNFNETISTSFNLDPEIEIGKRTDTLTVVRLLIDYSRWFISEDQTALLDPEDEANFDQINENIRRSLLLDWGKSDDRNNTDNGLPLVKADDVESTEDSTLVFSISLSNSSTNTVTVDYKTEDKTARAGNDYTAVSGTLRFEAGETEKVVKVTLNDDKISEGNEDLLLVLSNPGHSILDRTRINGTILDNDGMARVVVNKAEGSENDTNISFAVSLSTPSSSQVTLDYSTQDSTAAAGEDYEADRGTLEFKPGETNKEITIPLIDDDLQETDEIFILNIDRITGAEIKDDRVTGVIFDNDSAPVLNISDALAKESDGSISFTVSLTSPSAIKGSVLYETADGTAIAGRDYEATSGKVTFQPGDTKKSISVNLLQDDTVEPTERFKLKLHTPQNIVLGDAEGTGTITDSSRLTITTSDIRLNEFETKAVFRLSLNAKASQDVSVGYATEDGTAVSGEDFTAVNGNVIIPAGTVEQVIEIPLIDDQLDEADEEDFKLLLSDPTNAELDVQKATAIILDDDPLPGINLTGGEASEGSGEISFEISLSAPSSRTVSVDYSTSDESAISGEDYQPTTGSIEFEPGVTQKIITVPVVDDAISEFEESFNLSLTNSVNGSLNESSKTATGIINDNDMPGIVISDAQALESSGFIEFNLSIDIPSDPEVKVRYRTVDGTASSEDGDYQFSEGTVVFEPGQLSKSITITINNDNIDEGDAEEFKIELSNPVNAVLSDQEAVGTITDDDTTESEPPVRPGILAKDSEAKESDGSILFKIELSEPTSVPVSFKYETFDNSAKSGKDYVSDSGIVEFKPGETVAEISIQLIDDDIKENIEQFGLKLTDAVNADISDNVVHGRITDDDNSGNNGSEIIDPNKIRLTAICTTDDGKAEFRIRNRNSGSAEVSYDVAGLQNSRTFVTVEGMSEIFVLVPEKSTVRLFYNGKQIDVKASNPKKCQ